VSFDLVGLSAVLVEDGDSDDGGNQTVERFEAGAPF
jgi:hypothetical protein